MATDERDLDTVMHKALASVLPTDEPPIGIELGDVMRRGRRRFRARRAIPIAAAVVVAATLVAVPLTTDPGGPDPDRLPIGGTTTSDTPSSTVDNSPPPEFRLPQGHRRDEIADALTEGTAARMPEHVVTHFGTRSDRKDSGGRYGYGLHLLWREDGRHGYLAALHRTVGDFPASVYGMPAEPCMTPATRRPEYHCTPVTVPDGDVAYSYEIDKGYRVRGVVWDKRDLAEGGTVRITAVFFIPEPGGWTPFRALDDGPMLTRIPLSTEELASLIGVPS